MNGGKRGTLTRPSKGTVPQNPNLSSGTPTAVNDGYFAVALQYIAAFVLCKGHFLRLYSVVSLTSRWVHQ